MASNKTNKLHQLIWKLILQFCSLIFTHAIFLNFVVFFFRPIATTTVRFVRFFFLLLYRHTLFPVIRTEFEIGTKLRKVNRPYT